MQFKVILGLALAATGIQAAPGMSPRAESIPVRIFEGDDCGNQATTSNVPADGSCFGIAPVVSGETTSAFIDPGQLPSGCVVTLFADNTCSSVNFIRIPNAGQCFTFGIPQFIHSARTSGTC